MNTRLLLVASLALVFAPLAPVANAQVTISCEFCVTVTGANGYHDTVCHPIPCPGAGTKKLPYTELRAVPEGSACSVRTPHATVQGQMSGRLCQLNRSITPEDLK
jgi:hypothetical protein